MFIDTALRATGQTCGVVKTHGDRRIHKQPAKLLVSASLLPKDPVPKQKYQVKVPSNPSKVQDLSVAPAFGPKVKVVCTAADKSIVAKSYTTIHKFNKEFTFPDLRV